MPDHASERRGSAQSGKNLRDLNSPIKVFNLSNRKHAITKKACNRHEGAPSKAAQIAAHPGKKRNHEELDEIDLDQEGNTSPTKETHIGQQGNPSYHDPMLILLCEQPCEIEESMVIIIDPPEIVENLPLIPKKHRAIGLMNRCGSEKGRPQSESQDRGSQSSRGNYPDALDPRIL